MSTINFNDKVYAQEALLAFSATLTPLNAFSHSYNQEAKAKGAAIIVPRVGTLSTTTFSYADNGGFPYEGEGGTIDGITVNLDLHALCPFDITDKQTFTGLNFITLAQQQGRALGAQVLQTIWSACTTGNFGSPIVSLPIASYNARSMARARLGLVKRNAPTTGLSVIVNEDVYETMLGDSNFLKASEYGGSEAIREAKIPRAYGLTPYATNIMPTNGISLVGIAAHPDAIPVAMRYLAPQVPGAYDETAKLVDPTSGIVMGYRRHFNQAKGKMFTNLECLFGFTLGLTLGLGLLTRTD